MVQGWSLVPCPQNNITSWEECKNRETLFKSLESAAQLAEHWIEKGEAWALTLGLLLCAAGQVVAMFLLGTVLP